MTVIISPMDIETLKALPSGAVDLLIVIVDKWTQAIVEAVTRDAASKLKPEGGQLIIATSMDEAVERLI